MLEEADAGVIYRHNFDRGCILAAWKCDDTPPPEQHQQVRPPLSPLPFLNAFDDAVDAENTGTAPPLVQQTSSRLCPLCRHEAGICDVNELQVNLLLKDVIAKLYPLETECAATLEKQQSAARVVTPAAHAASLAARNDASTRFSFRAISSFVYVFVASVTDPPGFVLAVLLLLGLIAIACNPQHMFASSASSTVLSLADVVDHVLNGFSLLVREFSRTLDLLDQLKPWIRAFSFMF